MAARSVLFRARHVWVPLCLDVDAGNGVGVPDQICSGGRCVADSLVSATAVLTSPAGAAQPVRDVELAAGASTGPLPGGQPDPIFEADERLLVGLELVRESTSEVSPSVRPVKGQDVHVSRTPEAHRLGPNALARSRGDRRRSSSCTAAGAVARAAAATRRAKSQRLGSDRAWSNPSSYVAPSRGLKVELCGRDRETPP